MVKIKSRNQLLELTDRFDVLRYDDGRIDKINCYRNNTLIHTTQALYTTINGAVRLTGANGFLFNEVWNSLETPQLNWYDRKIKNINLNYDSGALAPHGATTRWTYTVPEGRKAFLEMLQLDMIRFDAATLTDQAFITIWYTPLNSTPQAILRLRHADKTAYSKTNLQIGQAITLSNGDLITCQTTDFNSDGTMIFFANAKLTEFDA